jgi:hypothetical protein
MVNGQLLSQILKILKHRALRRGQPRREARRGVRLNRDAAYHERKHHQN